MCTSVAGAALLGLPFAMALLGEFFHSYTNSSKFDHHIVLTTAPVRGSLHGHVEHCGKLWPSVYTYMYIHIHAPEQCLDGWSYLSECHSHMQSPWVLYAR